MEDQATTAAAQAQERNSVCESDGQGCASRARVDEGQHPPITYQSHTDSSQGGKGVELLDDKRHQRRDLGYIMRALRRGWITPWSVNAEDYAKLPAKVKEKMEAEHATDRFYLKGVRTLQEFTAQNIKLAEMADKAERLDDGRSTENIVFGKVDLTTLRGGGGEPPIGSHAGMEPD